MSGLLDLSPGDLELIVHRALEARDFQAVIAALKLMATKDPHRAAHLFYLLEIGLDLARSERAAAAGGAEGDRSNASDLGIPGEGR